MRRQARAIALAATGLTAAALAGCSVPREADLLASGSPTSSSTLTSVPTPTPMATPTPSLTPTSTPTPTPTPAPTRTRVAAPSAKSVPGYRLTTPPRAVGDPLAAVRGAGDLFDAVTVQSVVRGDTPVGVLFLFAVRSQALSDPSISSLVLPKVVDGVTGGGIKVSMRRFGSQRVAVGSSPTKGTVVLWYDAGVLAVVVGGGNPATVTDYARAYIARR